MGLDKFNNIYVTGANFNNCQIYPNVPTPPASLFLAKLDTNGNALWYKVMDSIDVHFAVDADGNCYYAGAIYDPTTIGGQLVSPIGMYDLIVVKYDSAGNYKWHYKTGVAGGGSIGEMVKIDPLTKDVWVAATMYLNTPIGLDTITNSYNMSYGVSAAIKLDKNGNVLKAYQANNEAPPANAFIDIGTTKVYFGGKFPGRVKIGSDSLTSNGQYDIFFAEIDKASNQLTLKAALPSSGSDDFGYQLCHDGQGNLYLAGAFDGIATVNGQNYSLVGGETDAFVAKWGYTSCTTGIENLNGQDKNTLQITPNPASSLINIFAKQLYSKKATLYIYDITGHLIYHSVHFVSYSYFSTNINIEHFANGFYTVVLQTDNERIDGRLMQKFVKD